jgi:hypothetical protein
MSTVNRTSRFLLISAFGLLVIGPWSSAAKAQSPIGSGIPSAMYEFEVQEPANSANYVPGTQFRILILFWNDDAPMDLARPGDYVVARIYRVGDNVNSGQSGNNAVAFTGGDANEMSFLMTTPPAKQTPEGPQAQLYMLEVMLYSQGGLVKDEAQVFFNAVP